MPRRLDRGYGSQFIRAFTTRDEDWTREKPGSEIPFTASTGNVAKDQMALRPDRWRIDNYRRSGGPVLWQHDHSRPAIGNGRPAVEPKRLRIHVVFDQEDDFAKTIESKLRRRVLRSSSVGWNFVDEAGEVLKNQRLSPTTLANYAYQDLDEMSIVNVGSDPFAIAERAASNRDALRRIDKRLVSLYDAQERFDSDVNETELRRALIDYCDRLGLDLRHIRAADDKQKPDDGEYDVEADADDMSEEDAADQGEDEEDDNRESEEDDADSGLVRRSQLPDLLRAHGLNPKLPGEPEPVLTRSANSVDRQAMDSILSAFAPLVRT